MSRKIFVVDDHYMVIEGIRSLLQTAENMEMTGHAMTAASCLSFLQTSQPDVILMDINLPDQSGIDLCKTVKELYPSVRVIGLSTFNQQSFINKMIQQGASGYVLKNATKEELTDAIETVLSGKNYLSGDVAKLLKKGDPTEVILTRREKEVLQLIADGLTNTEIADKIFVSITTVDSHRKNLLAKFDVKNTALLIRLAVEKGLID